MKISNGHALLWSVFALEFSMPWPSCFDQLLIETMRFFKDWKKASLRNNALKKKISFEHIRLKVDIKIRLEITKGYGSK